VSEPINPEREILEFLARRRRRRLPALRARLPDPRPTAPGQVALVGLGLILLGLALPAARPALLAGALLLLLALLSGMIEPRGRTVTWRGRAIDLPPEPRWTDRLYNLLYRRPVGPGPRGQSG
jgi:hypothetical protein